MDFGIIVTGKITLTKYICSAIFRVRVRVMVLSATINHISVISWMSVLLVEETGVPRKNHQPVASH
jgi:hypothetical protein